MMTGAPRVDDIFAASRRGDLDAVRRFLEANPALVNSHDDSGHTPLYYATERGHSALMDHLAITCKARWIPLVKMGGKATKAHEFRSHLLNSFLGFKTAEETAAERLAAVNKAKQARSEAARERNQLVRNTAVARAAGKVEKKTTKYRPVLSTGMRLGKGGANISALLRDDIEMEQQHDHDEHDEHDEHDHNENGNDAPRDGEGEEEKAAPGFAALGADVVLSHPVIQPPGTFCFDDLEKALEQRSGSANGSANGWDLVSHGREVDEDGTEWELVSPKLTESGVSTPMSFVMVDDRATPVDATTRKQSYLEALAKHGARDQASVVPGRLAPPQVRKAYNLRKQIIESVMAPTLDDEDYGEDDQINAELLAEGREDRLHGRATKTRFHPGRGRNKPRSKDGRTLARSQGIVL